MKLYNTMSLRVEEFVPLEAGKVKIYTCGPTVYNYAHIGNLRTYVSEDILVRSLRYLGYDVTRAMNITDVGHLESDADEGEDKMLKGARRERKTVWQIAEYYTQAFFADMAKLGLETPDIVMRATDQIEDYIEFIQVLEDKGFAYRAGGNVYFDVAKFPDYTKLSRMPLENLQHGSRDVELDDNKRNPYDFALWFTKSKFDDQEMKWDSPFGRGYPGWHLECSVIALKALGEQLDIHCGGVDHIATHHTNEIAQTESYTGKKWVNYWWHAEFLLTDDGKMSKSKGEFLSLSRLEELGYSPMDYKYFLLGSHYRRQLAYSDEGMDSARTAYQKLKERILALPEAEVTSAYLDDFKATLADDLNTANALTLIYTVLKDNNLNGGEKRYIIEQIDSVLGLELFVAPVIDLDIDLIEGLIAERNQAKLAKDWATADSLREKLLAMGITIMDTKEGTTWKAN